MFSYVKGGGGGGKMALRILPALLLLAAMALAGVLLPEPRAAEATTPSVTAIRIATTPGADGYYATGDRISFELTFDQTMKSWPSPYRSSSPSTLANCFRMSFLVGSATRYACGQDYPNAGHNSTTVLFHYDVVAADHDADGISVPTAAVLSNESQVTHTDSGSDHQISVQTALPDTLNSAQATHKVNNADYDTDDDDLIEITTLAQLNAIRYDLDGQGDQDSVSATNWNTYKTAFHGSAADMGCASGAGMCAGYELDADLDFAGDTTYANWVPIGVFSSTDNTVAYRGNFNGNGHTISNLRINLTNSTTNYQVGLFGAVGGSAVIEKVGLLNVHVDSTHNGGGTVIGTLAGLLFNTATVRYSYATGAVNGASTGGGRALQVGGLVGEIAHTATVAASWSSVAVTANLDASGAYYINAGGLIGLMQGSGSTLTASYATGPVSTNSNRVDYTISGGLVGWTNTNATIQYSYSRGAVTHAGQSSQYIGGALGNAVGSPTITELYWDTDTSGIAADNFGAARSTSDLQTPTEYGASGSGSIYENWNVNVDGDTTTGTPTIGGDDPWDFGESDEYPILRFEYGSAAAANERETRARNLQIPRDYDSDDDDLIEVDSLAQLNAIRWDLDGDGTAAGAGSSGHAVAFPQARNDMGCPNGCIGYELDADLDFAGSAYAAAGWTPIGAGFVVATSFSGQFNGRGHTISNLPISAGNIPYVGLFGNVSGDIEQVGLLDVNIAFTRNSGDTNVGALAGLLISDATVRYSYATGAVNATIGSGASRTRAGGLIGEMAHTSQLTASWAGVNVTVDSAATSGFDNVTGLVGGANNGTGVAITACYAAGDVHTTRNSTDSAGLGGWLTGGATLSYSYSIGSITHTGTSGTIGGAVGGRHSAATLTQVYWDNQASGIPTDNYGVGYSTSAMQTPTTYGAAAGDAYFGWNIDLDNADGDNDPATNTAPGRRSSPDCQHIRAPTAPAARNPNPQRRAQ